MSAPAGYPRDLVGYGRRPPFADWLGRARVAVQFVLNYEEGGENCLLHGDAGSEQFLSEMFTPPSYPDRHLSMEPPTCLRCWVVIRLCASHQQKLRLCPAQ